jgi:hypothetical protein
MDELKRRRTKKPRPQREKRGFMDFAGLLRMSKWCLRPESNRHAFRRLILSQVRLPIPPQRLQAQARILAHAMPKRPVRVWADPAYDLAYLENRPPAVRRAR